MSFNIGYSDPLGSDPGVHSRNQLDSDDGCLLQDLAVAVSYPTRVMHVADQGDGLKQVRNWSSDSGSGCC